MTSSPSGSRPRSNPSRFRDLVCSIPGISTSVADVIIAETGADMTRFHRRAPGLMGRQPPRLPRVRRMQPWWAIVSWVDSAMPRRRRDVDTDHYRLRSSDNEGGPLRTVGTLQWTSEVASCPRRTLGIGGPMDILTGPSKVEELLRKAIGDEGRLELSNTWVQTVLRVARQLRDVIHEQQAELAAKIAPARAGRARSGHRGDHADGHRAWTGPPLPGPAEQAPAPTTPRVEATSAEIRAWAREHQLAVGDRGVIPKRIIEAFGLANAS